MYKRPILLAVLTATALPAVAQAISDTFVVDLQQVIRRVLEVSPELDAARASQRHAEAQHALARSSRFLTDVQATSAVSMVPGITNPNNTPSDALYSDPDVRNDFSNLSPFAQTEVLILQPLHTWGALGGSIGAATAGVKVELNRVLEKETEAALRGAALYYNVLLTRELSWLTDRAGEIVEQAMGEIERLLQEGDPDVDDADRYQVLIVQQEYTRRVVEVAENLLLAQTALRRQLMLPAQAALEPTHESLEPLVFVPADLDVYQEAALRLRPELLQARAALTAREALVRVAHADYYPRIVLGFSFSVSGASNRYRQPNPFIADGFRKTSARTGFGFQQKLNFSQTRARVAQARAKHKESEHMLTAAEQLVLLEVEEAWRSLVIEEAALAAQDSTLSISKEWLRVENINFDLDLGDTENLVRAVQANLELEALYLQAVRRYNIAVLRLLAASGMLIQELDMLIG